LRLYRKRYAVIICISVDERNVINLVVGCTARKRLGTRDGVRLHDVPRFPKEKRFERWVALLDESGSSESAICGFDLYCGDAWSVTSDAISGCSKRFTVNLAVVSAGYGLVRPTERLLPYSATFTRTHPDSVLAARERSSELKAWWCELCRWRSSNNQTPASIQQLASRFPEHPLLIALSREYLAAVADDLILARKQLRSPDLMIIVSSGAKKDGPLAENFLPCDARLEQVFGGVRSSLNARIVRHILATESVGTMKMSQVKPRFEFLLEQQPSARTFRRQRMNDDEVIKFIQTCLAESPGRSCSALLAALRRSDHACEQSRFRKIFAATKTS
jgi:hypothetical protein